MWLNALICFLCAYLLGNLNGSVCISALMHDDVRSHGSGNAGLTNFIRNYGASKSLGVIAVDGSKAALACLVGGLLLEDSLGYFNGMCIGGFAVMLGHDYPVLLGFKGGKAVLSCAFVAFTIDWRIGLIALAVFALFYLTTQYVSLGSVLGAATISTLFAVFHHGEGEMIGMILGIAMGLLVIVLHHGNIVRLIKGNERKTNLFGKGSRK